MLMPRSKVPRFSSLDHLDRPAFVATSGNQLSFQVSRNITASTARQYDLAAACFQDLGWSRTSVTMSSIKTKDAPDHRQ